MSANQIHRMIGVSYKSTWFMCHRIREAMDNGSGGLLGGNGGPVEADETYWGNTGKQARGARGYAHKMKVVSLVERNGEKRSFYVANVTAKTVGPILREQVAKNARLITDESGVYNRVGKEFASHEKVNHSSGEYARGDVTTNTVESILRFSNVPCMALFTMSAKLTYNAMQTSLISAGIRDQNLGSATWTAQTL